MKSKSWNCLVVGISLAILLILALATIIIDPFWHYHKGLEGLEYPLKDDRYQNDGIARYSEYDSIITGTSMSQLLIQEQAFMSQMKISDVPFLIIRI